MPQGTPIWVFGCVTFYARYSFEVGFKGDQEEPTFRDPFEKDPLGIASKERPKMLGTLVEELADLMGFAFDPLPQHQVRMSISLLCVHLAGCLNCGRGKQAPWTTAP